MDLKGMETRNVRKFTVPAVIILIMVLALIVPQPGNNEQAQAAGKSVTFHGHGKGHGVGLCMAGVYFRGLWGHDYHNIIHTYYNGISFSPVSDDHKIREQLIDRKSTRLNSSHGYI